MTRNVIVLKNFIHIATGLFLLLMLHNEPLACQDTIPPSPAKNKILQRNSLKATMLAATFPGLGQVYNGKYWKVPLVYTGFAGLGYFVAYNTKWYNTYIHGYQDFTDNIPETDSYTAFITAIPPEEYDPVLHPDTYNPSTEAWIKDQVLRQIDYFRQYRDLSYIGLGLWYILSILDANVDASLLDYDISENLGISLAPFQTPFYNFAGAGVNLTLTINF